MQIETGDTKLFMISAGFARHQNLPVSFVAKVLRDTPKAVYVYGHGEIDPRGRCCVCGKTLTHPGSIKLGIGPVCLGNWDAREDAFASMTREQVQALAHDQRIDSWLPRSVIMQTDDTDERIQVPAEHQMLDSKRKRTKTADEPAGKQAFQVRFRETGKPAIKILFPFDPATLELVKLLPGRKFHPDAQPKYWSCPLSVEAVEKLAEWDFQLDDALREFLKRSKIRVDDQSDDIHIPGLRQELRPYQKQAVSFIEAKGGRALIADQMRLGKTAQALAWLQLHPEKRPVVVVAPATAKFVWLKEARKWMSDPRVQVLSGKQGRPIDLSDGDIVVINYDILPNQYKKNPTTKKKNEVPRTGWVDYLLDLNPLVLITDEAHKYKNNKANRTKAVKKLGKKTPHVIPLTGTPILSRPIEMFNAINLVDSTVFPSFWHYAKSYCGATHNGYGWDFTGASNTEELHKRLTDTIMIRRRRSDVEDQLPEEQYIHVPLELDNRNEYRTAEKDFVNYVRDNVGAKAANKASRAEALTRINGLKQLAMKGKLKAATDWIEDFLDGGDKLVLFAIHKEAVAALMKQFGDRAVKIDGSTSQAQRQKAAETFQEDDRVRLFVGNIQAASEGIDLSAATDVAFLELPWTPGQLEQAAFRIQAVGKTDAIGIHYLLANGTIDEDMAELLDVKRGVVDQVLDGEQPDEGSMLGELMARYSERQRAVAA